MKKSQRYITSLLLTMIYLVIVSSSLGPFAMYSPVVARKDSCAKCMQRQPDADDQEIQRIKKRPHNETVYKCGGPCEKGMLALASAGSSELLPYSYSEIIGPSHEDVHYSNFSQRMASRYATPPDPPPRLLPSSI